MSENMLGELPLSEIQGPRDDLETKLAGEDGKEWLDALKRFLRKENPWGEVKKAVKSKLLKFLGTVTVPATTERFVAKNKFKVNATDGASVKISYVGDNFTKWFLSGSGKTEDSITEQILCYHKLRQSSVDGPIIAKLGGAENSETMLSEMFSLMEKQGKGEDGVLLNKGCANIFYIRDQNGVLRAVDVLWYDDGWLVHANSLGYPRRWGGGDQVFSRNLDL